MQFQISATNEIPITNPIVLICCKWVFVADHLFEAMMYVENSVYFDQPDSVITDWQVMLGIIKKCGFRYRLVSPPSEQDNEQAESQDVTKR